MRLVFTSLLLSCMVIACKQNQKKHQPIARAQAYIINDSSFLNKINYPTINTDSIEILPNQIAELQFNFSEINDGLVYKINFKGFSDTLELYGETLEFYLEEDFDNDGVREIGILPGFKTSACRIYYLYSIQNGVWRKIAETRTHLPDRMNGINYFSKLENKIEILSASDNCCCQCDCLISTTNK